MSGLTFKLPWFEIRDMEKRRVEVRLEREEKGRRRRCFNLLLRLFKADAPKPNNL